MLGSGCKPDTEFWAARAWSQVYVPLSQALPLEGAKIPEAVEGL